MIRKTIEFGNYPQSEVKDESILKELNNKIDALPYFDFNMKKCISNIKYRNKDATIIPISAKTGENIDLVAKYFKETISAWRKNWYAREM